MTIGGARWEEGLTVWYMWDTYGPRTESLHQAAYDRGGAIGVWMLVFLFLSVLGRLRGLVWARMLKAVMWVGDVKVLGQGADGQREDWEGEESVLVMDQGNGSLVSYEGWEPGVRTRNESDCCTRRDASLDTNCLLQLGLLFCLDIFCKCRGD